jgi:hypothetical protein
MGRDVSNQAHVRRLSASTLGVDVHGKELLLVQGARTMVLDRPTKLRLLELLLDGELRAEMVRRGEVVDRG